TGSSTSSAAPCGARAAPIRSSGGSASWRSPVSELPRRLTPNRLTPQKPGLLPAVSAPPALPLLFARVLMAFVRRELAQISRHRFYVLTRTAAFGFAVVSLYFFSRFVGATPNQHLQPYGGDYLAFGLVGLLVTELQYVGVT